MIRSSPSHKGLPSPSLAARSISCVPRYETHAGFGVGLSVVHRLRVGEINFSLTALRRRAIRHRKSLLRYGVSKQKPLKCVPSGEDAEHALCWVKHCRVRSRLCPPFTVIHARDEPRSQEWLPRFVLTATRFIKVHVRVPAKGPGCAYVVKFNLMYIRVLNKFVRIFRTVCTVIVIYLCLSVQQVRRIRF